MSRFRLEDYEGQYVMHVKTKEEYDTFSKFLYKNGKTWGDGYGYLERSYWEFYENEICFEFDCGAYSDLGYYRSQDYTILEFSNFDWKGEELKEFKVGDWVKSKCFSGVKEIKGIHCDFATTTDSCNYYLKDLEMAYKFTKGQEVEVSANGEGYVRSYKEKFYGYDSSLKKPFLVIDENGDITNWKYCRAFHKYEPYTEFDPNWIGKDICYNAEFMWTIVGRQKDGEVVLYNDEDGYTEQTFSELIEYTWEETGKPFGKEDD